MQMAGTTVSADDFGWPNRVYVNIAKIVVLSPEPNPDKILKVRRFKWYNIKHAVIVNNSLTTAVYTAAVILFTSVPNSDMISTA